MPSQAKRRVLISYTPDDEHHQMNVLSVADALLEHGSQCIVDNLEAAAKSGDAAEWMRTQIRAADVVLVTCSKGYRDAWERTDPRHERAWQIGPVREAVEQNNGLADKIVALLIRPSNDACIPAELRSVIRHDLDLPDGLSDFCRRIPHAPEPKPRPGFGVVRVTELLGLIRSGDVTARDRLASMIDSELRIVAANRLRAVGNRSIRATELVNLAYVRLLERGELEAVNRRHLFAIFKIAMAELLIDQYRASNALKRGGDHKHVPLIDIEQRESGLEADIPRLLAALEELALIKPEEAEIVSLKFFCGQTYEQIQALLNMTESQVRTKWENAKRWLFARIHSPDAPPDRPAGPVRE